VTSLQLRAVELTPATFHLLSPLINWWESTPADLSKTKLVAEGETLAVTGAKNKWGPAPDQRDRAVSAGRRGRGCSMSSSARPEVRACAVHRRWSPEGSRQLHRHRRRQQAVVRRVASCGRPRLSTGKPLPGAQVTVRDATGKADLVGDHGCRRRPPCCRAPASSRRPSRRARPRRARRGRQPRETCGSSSRTRATGRWSTRCARAGSRRGTTNVSMDHDRRRSGCAGFMHTDSRPVSPRRQGARQGLARVTKLGEPLAVFRRGQKVKVEVAWTAGQDVRGGRGEDQPVRRVLVRFDRSAATRGS